MTVESHEQKAERAQREAERRHRERLEKEREARLLALNERRAEARQRAVARNEKFWKRREREDAYAEKVRDAWETAYTDQVVFLPQMPEAATMARKTWAREPVRERTPDRDCVRKEIEGLSDVWAGSIVRAWAKPSKESEAAKALKKAGRGAKGKAPQARQFKISPRLPPIV